ncbi:hypothetical protein D3C86_1495270 [compost metagenome]
MFPGKYLLHPAKVHGLPGREWTGSNLLCGKLPPYWEISDDLLEMGQYSNAYRWYVRSLTGFDFSSHSSVKALPWRHRQLHLFAVKIVFVPYYQFILSCGEKVIFFSFLTASIIRSLNSRLVSKRSNGLLKKNMLSPPSARKSDVTTQK